MSEESVFRVTLQTEDAEQNLENLHFHVERVGERLEETVAQTHATQEYAEQTVRVVEVQLQQTRENVSMTAFASVQILNNVMQTIRGFLSLLGDALDPAFQAILSGIMAAVQGLIAIASAMYSNPWTLAFAIATTIASVALNVSGGLAVAQGQQDAARNLQQAQRMLHIGRVWI